MMADLDVHGKLCGFLAVEIAGLSQTAESDEIRLELEKASSSLLTAKGQISRAKYLAKPEAKDEVA